MSKKMTAVEYLAQSVIVLGVLSPSEVIKAIQLEREQIEEAFDKGEIREFDKFIDGEQYYTQTYGKCTQQ